MPRRISEQVVVVAGASSGVGRAIARAFGAAGAKVGLIARTREALENAAREIQQAGGEPLVLPLDVAEAPAVEKAAAHVVERWGRIDTWVNSAMVSVFSPVSQMRADEYRRVTDVNYLGTVHGTLAALKYMRAQRSGTVLQIGSALAYRSVPLQSAYCATKAAIRGFTDSLRCELFHEKSPVQLCMLQLPAVNTPQFEVVRTRLPRHPKPLPPIFQPEVIAKAVLHAAEHPAREIWIGGSAVKAIVGQRLVPGLLDRYLARIGYDAQQADRPVAADRPDNVFAALPGDRGARGSFGAEARPYSVELWARTHRGVLAAAAIAGAVALALRARRA
jgi:NADP-dependent 3-hydroxy acid dehydrogenase YdfG